MAYPNGYTYRRKLTISSADVSGTSDFTDITIRFTGVYSYLADTSNGGKVTSSAGNDIRFETTGGTKLDHNLSFYDNTTGEIVVKLQIPTLSHNTDTELYIYYGNSGAAAEENISGTYSADYDFDVTFDDDTGNDALGNLTPTEDGVTYISGYQGNGRAASFDGSSNIIETNTISNKTAFTLNALVKVDDNVPEVKYVTRDFGGGTDWAWYLGQFGGDYSIGIQTDTGYFSAESTSSLGTTNYAFLTVIWDGTDLTLYVNGSLEATVTPTGTKRNADSKQFVFGGLNDGVQEADANIQEVSFLNTNRTSDWAATQSNLIGENSISVGNQEASWYDTNWQNRFTATANATQVDGNLTDYAYYYDLSEAPSGFWSKVDTNGDDIRVTQSDGTTQVPFEIVDIDTSAQTGELHFKGDTNSASDVDFYIYYNNPSASPYSVTATYGRNNVWTDYTVVHHMESDPSGTAPQLIDSTGNGHDLSTGGSMTSGDSVSGQVGNAVDFDGSNDFAEAADAAGLDLTSSMTLMAWAKWNSGVAGSYHPIFQKGEGNTAGTIAYGLLKENNGDRSRISISNGTSIQNIFSTTNHVNSTWYHLAGTADGSTVRMFVDGVEENSASQSYNASNLSTSLTVANSQSGYAMNGSVDEIRIADTALSGDYIGTTYNNLSAPATFWSTGAEQSLSTENSVTHTADTFVQKENSGSHTTDVYTSTGSWYDSNWTYRMEVTVKASMVDADETDFPLFIDLADLGADFHTNVKSDGSDIRVTLADATTEVPIDTVYYDAANDRGMLYLKHTDTLSATTDTSVYVYYGNASASAYASADTYGRNATWSMMKHAYLFAEDPTGTSPQLVDRTGNGNDGSYLGSMTSGDLVYNGSIRGVRFDGTDDRVSPPDDIGGTAVTELYVQMLIKSNEDPQADAYSGPMGYSQGVIFREHANGYVEAYVRDGANSAWDTVNTNGGAGTYGLSLVTHFMNWSASAETMEFWENGTSQGTTAVASNAYVNPRPTQIGAISGNYYDGDIYHIFIAEASLGGSFGITSDRNHRDSSNFYTVGAQETQSTTTEYSVNQTTDALIQDSYTSSHSSDALAQASYNPTHTADTIAYAENEVAHTADVISQKEQSINHSADTIAKKTNSRSFTSDSILQKKQDLTHSADIYNFQENSKAHSVDTLLQKEQIISHSVDALVFEEFNRIHTSDVYTRITQDVLHSGDVLAQKEQSSNHTSDTTLTKEASKQHSVDTVAVDAFDQQHNTDTYTNLSPTLVHSSDTLIVDTALLDHSLDTLVFETSDAAYIVDTYTQTTNSSEHLADTVVKSEEQLQHTVDTFVQAQAEASHSGDVRTQGTSDLQHTADTVVQKQQAKQHTSDTSSYLLQQIQHTSDALLQQVSDATHFADVASKQTLDSQHSTDAAAYIENSLEHTKDTYLYLKQESEHTSDTYVGNLIEVSHTADAIITGPITTVSTPLSNDNRSTRLSFTDEAVSLKIRETSTKLSTNADRQLSKANLSQGLIETNITSGVQDVSLRVTSKETNVHYDQQKSSTTTAKEALTIVYDVIATEQKEVITTELELQIRTDA